MVWLLLLLDIAAEIDAQWGYCDNALQALYFDYEKVVVQFLLDEGADINAQGGYYNNAL